MHLREPEHFHSLRAELKQQLRQTGCAILGEGAEGHNLSALVKHVTLNPLVGSLSTERSQEVCG